MKFTSIFFTASADYIRAERKYSHKRAKKRSLLRYFSKRQREISVACDDGTFMFPKECGLPPQRLCSREAQINNKRAKKDEACFDIFQSERRLCSREAQISHKRARNMKFAFDLYQIYNS
ncbi:MAG: hypothetical protein IJB60_07135 [Bacteroidaceae bacterium]|nr:hypothetical protein [Bacteroidaceae bacterium]